MTSQQRFSVWTKLKVNKSFIVYPHKYQNQCFPLLLWTEAQPVHTPVLTQAYGPALSQSNFSILSVFCLVYNNIFLLTGLRIYTGEYQAQGPTLCPTEGRALRGPRALDLPV